MLFFYSHGDIRSKKKDDKFLPNDQIQHAQLSQTIRGKIYFPTKAKPIDRQARDLL